MKYRVEIPTFVVKSIKETGLITADVEAESEEQALELVRQTIEENGPCDFDGENISIDYDPEDDVDVLNEDAPVVELERAEVSPEMVWQPSDVEGVSELAWADSQKA